MVNQEKYPKNEEIVACFVLLWEDGQILNFPREGIVWIKTLVSKASQIRLDGI